MYTSKFLLARLLLVLIVAIFPLKLFGFEGQKFIPISGGGITLIIPAVSTPASAELVKDAQGDADNFDITWNAVTGAQYYKIVVIDENDNEIYIEVDGTYYSLGNLPLGLNKIFLLACDSTGACGAAVDLGSHYVDTTVEYVHADVLGSPIVKTDAGGNVVARFHYKPYGEVKESIGNQIGYTGHVYDSDLGLSYMQARYYDPKIGRFYSTDPVTHLEHIGSGNSIQGFNRYAYTYNNPYKYIDPTGLIPEGSIKANRISETSFDRSNKGASFSTEVVILRNGKIWRRHDRMQVVGDKIKFTEIKSFDLSAKNNSKKRQKRRLGRAANYTIKQKLSDVYGSSQQFRDMFMLHQSDLSEYTIPRLNNAKLSDFSDVTVVWELYDVNTKSEKVVSKESYDLSTPQAVQLGVKDINN